MASPTVYGTPNTSFHTTDSDAISYTNTVGSEQNTALFVAASSGNANPSVTYNGVGMTQIYKGTANQNTCLNLWYMANPPTGTHNVVVTYGENRAYNVLVWTFQDCAQSSPTDITLVQSNNSSGTSASNSATTATNNDAVITSIGTNSSPTGYTPDGSQILIGTFVQGHDNAQSISYIAKATAGSITTGYTWTNSSGWDLNIGAIKYVAPTPVGPANVKTFDGVTQSTGIKTYFGVAKASVKTVNGVS